jgi:hypothetical protein
MTGDPGKSARPGQSVAKQPGEVEGDTDAQGGWVIRESARLGVRGAGG